MSDITRRSFFNRAGTYGLGGLAGVGALQALVSRPAMARSAVQPRLDWLSQTDEAASEPALPTIDPHQHFGDRPGKRDMSEHLFGNTTAPK